MLLAGTALAWGLYYVAPLLLVPVLGDRYAGTEPVIRTVAMLALVQACEVVMGRLMLCADLQIARAAVIAVGAAVALALNLLLIHPLGVDGAIYAAVLSYIVIDLLYIVALRGRLGGANLARIFLTLAASVAAGIVAAWLCAATRSGYWTAALASAVSFIAVAGAGFGYGRRLAGGETASANS